jgi:hypothetical protein
MNFLSDVAYRAQVLGRNDYSPCFLFVVAIGKADAKLMLRGIAPRTEKKMITLRAIKGTAPTDLRYHRFGESYEFCTWAIESAGESKAPNWLRADDFGFGPIRKIDCESCPAFAPCSPKVMKRPKEGITQAA